MTIIGPYVHKAKNLRGRSFLMIVSLLLMDVSCASYYLHATTSVNGLPTFPVDQSKTVVLHQGNRFARLKSFEMHESELTGVPAGQLESDGEPPEDTTSDQVAREVHVYLDETTPLVVEPGSPIVVPFSSINKVAVYDEDTSKPRWWIEVLKGFASAVLVVLYIAAQLAVG